MTPYRTNRVSRRKWLRTTTAVATFGLIGSGSHLRRSSAAGRWPFQRHAGPFACHSDFDLASYRELIAGTGRLRRDLVQALGIETGREPIHLFLFSRKSVYQAYMKHYYPDVPHRRALFMKGRGPGMVFAYRNPELGTDLRHECTHALLHSTLPMVPLWLDEGLAEYFEVPANQRADDHPHLSAIRTYLKTENVPSMAGLEDLKNVEQMGTPQYQHAWAWVHFLLHGSPDGHRLLVQYIADLEAHNPPGRLSRRLTTRLPNVDQLFRRHILLGPRN